MNQPIEATEAKKFPNVNSLWPDWHKEAMCLRRTNTDYFSSSNSRRAKMENEEAAFLCARCPVFDECLNSALSNQEEYGMWALTYPPERRRIFYAVRRRLISDSNARNQLEQWSHERRTFLRRLLHQSGRYDYPGVSPQDGGIVSD